MTKEVKITIVTPEQAKEEDFKEPSRWYVICATGDRIYFHCRDRANAQKYCDEQFSVGKYTIRTDKMIKPKGDVTVKSTLNSFSRKGMRTKGN